MPFIKIKASSIISCSPDINTNDNSNFKYGRGENYCLDSMSYIIYYSTKCLSVMFSALYVTPTRRGLSK